MALYEVTFCKVMVGKGVFGSRGMMNSIGWEEFDWNDISFVRSSNSVNDIDRDRFVGL